MKFLLEGKLFVLCTGQLMPLENTELIALIKSI